MTNTMHEWTARTLRHILACSLIVSCGTLVAPICWVMPPASPSWTFVLRNWQQHASDTVQYTIPTFIHCIGNDALVSSLQVYSEYPKSLLAIVDRCTVPYHCNKVLAIREKYQHQRKDETEERSKYWQSVTRKFGAAGWEDSPRMKASEGYP